MMHAKEEEEEGDLKMNIERDKEGDDHVSILALLVVALRKSLIGCSKYSSSSCDPSSMEIGLPSNVRHVAHVTFDRFNGFLGLPVEFEPEMTNNPICILFIYFWHCSPLESLNILENIESQVSTYIIHANIFGVSTESMQLSYDATRGNSVPTLLLLMQRQLYAQGGLQVEGIFRINAENSQEELVREQLNRGIVPYGIDVHCLAGLIKAWFRELLTGVLDPLSPEQVMQSQSEEECAQLVRFLPQTEATLLDWGINLMADVAQLEHLNKMNARNVAMMADPLTALMHVVQVMNFLKTLEMKTLREREGSTVKSNTVSDLNSFGDDNHQSSSQLKLKDGSENGSDFSEEDKVFVAEEPSQPSYPSHLIEYYGYETKSGSKDLHTPTKNIIPRENSVTIGDQANICKSKSLDFIEGPAEKNRTSITRFINLRKDLAEAWR
ncbi:hypothetical protein JHK82_027204 [Glycine max]|uniref:Rho-GAP domain-containing protein n=1 Tax=Glycine max TaxID=3847 RepID=K7LHY0_SOYBN|nr:hypothetical protein JHK87_027095 [Glycine soja]KAG5126369.1 hypothetical protein JHK82_027204 [Glycine max]KAH1137210.1 hypothetical protein GYH30_027265 [Glycine max]KRH32770.1 hypothetical protein GLYMA_10G074400v4 [Glycine max]